MGIIGTEGFDALPKYCGALSGGFFAAALVICGIRGALRLLSATCRQIGRCIRAVIKWRRTICCQSVLQWSVPVPLAGGTPSLFSPLPCLVHADLLPDKYARFVPSPMGMGFRCAAAATPSCVHVPHLPRTDWLRPRHRQHLTPDKHLRHPIGRVPSCLPLLSLLLLQLLHRRKQRTRLLAGHRDYSHLGVAAP